MHKRAVFNFGEFKSRKCSISFLPFDSPGTGILNSVLDLRGRQAAPTKREWEIRLQLAPVFSAPMPQSKRKPPYQGWFSFGWGTGIRTPEMSESESDALPLGDAPIFSTDDIIADNLEFVKGFFKKSLKFFQVFLPPWATPDPVIGGIGSDVSLSASGPL